MENNSSNTGPVFIAGCGRSGTSLIRTLVDAHPAVFIPSESLFLVDYLRYGRTLPTSVFRKLLYNEPQLLCWYCGPRITSYNVADTLSHLHLDMAKKRGAIIWGQKTPRFVRERKLLEKSYPDCRWILIYRDPRAVYASMRRSGQHTNSISIACKRWIRDNTEIVKFVRDPSSKPSNVLLIQYETLVRQPARTMEHIFHFLCLPIVPLDELLDKARPVFFPRSRFFINTVRGGALPDISYSDAWKSVLSPNEIGFVENTCKDEMETLGYELLDYKQSFSRLKDSFRIVQDIRIIYRYMRYWPMYPIYHLLRRVTLLLFSLRNTS